MISSILRSKMARLSITKMIHSKRSIAHRLTLWPFSAERLLKRHSIKSLNLYHSFANSYATFFLRLLIVTAVTCRWRNILRERVYVCCESLSDRATVL